MKKKRRGNQDGSYYQRADGQWIASISVRTLDGKLKRRTKFAKSPEHARLLLLELQDKYRYPREVESMTVADLLTRWLAQTKGEESTLDSHKAAINKRIKPLIGHYLVEKCTALIVEEWTQKMAADEIGARTRLQAFRTFSLAMNYAVKMQIVGANPCNVVPAPQYKRADIHPFTDEEVQAILNETQGTRYGPLYQLAFTTGMRQGELFGLKWSDVDWTHQTIKVERQAREYKGHVRLKEPKTKAGIRTIQLTPQTIEVLGAMPRPMQLDAMLFTSPHGQIIRANNFRKRQWVPLLKKLNINHRGFHHVRHTAATMMLKSKVPAIVVSGVIGHSKVSTTQDIYGHYIPSDSSQAAAVMSHIGAKQA